MLIQEGASYHFVSKHPYTKAHSRQMRERELAGVDFFG